MSEREQFEKWAKEQGDSCARQNLPYHGQYYVSIFTEWEWKAWQAGRQAGLEEAARIAEEKAQAWRNEAEKHRGFTLGTIYGANASHLEALAVAIREVAKKE